MKRFRFNKRHPKYLQFKEKLHRRAMAGVAARARKRMEAHADDPPLPAPDPRPLFILTIQGREYVHRLVAFPARRRNSLRVMVDGREWRRSIGLSRLMAGLRKRILNIPDSPVSHA